MNAYELADELQKFYDELDGSFGYLEQSINMLRQQADRIAELEKELQESAMNCISAYAQADDHYARLQELEAKVRGEK